MSALYLLFAAACALAATIVAALGLPPLVLGLCGAGAFVGLAGAAASAAVELHAPDDLREPRERHGPTTPAPLPQDGRTTRKVFGRLWLTMLSAFAVLGAVPLIALSRKPGRRVRTGWKAGLRLVTADNIPIRADHLESGGIETVFPENGVNVPDAAAVLVRVAPDALTMPPDRSDWTPQGYVAYSKICTHAGCPVALYRAQTHQLYCPCHQSLFDVLDVGKNVAGPAPRPLPQLGLAVDGDGYLIARAGFSGPVGPDDWYRTP